jgi:hypothetical protein
MTNEEIGEAFKRFFKSLLLGRIHPYWGVVSSIEATKTGQQPYSIQPHFGDT